MILSHYNTCTTALKVSGTTIPLTSARILKNKSSYADLAEKIAVNGVDENVKLDEDLLLAIISSRVTDEPHNEATVLPAAHEYFTKNIYSIGNEVKDYGISDKSEVWTISSSGVLSEYFIGRQIGSGSFGKAKLALPVGKSSVADIVVIKMEEYKINKKIRIRTDLENEKEMYLEFGGIAGIPKVGDVGDFAKKGSVEIPTHAGMPMQVLGTSLDKLQVLCGGKFSVPTVTVIAIQMLERLRAIHAKNVLHRDIKPQNICINRLLDSREPRIFNLIDFGLSKKFSLDVNIGFRTMTGVSNIGSPVYMSRRCHRGKLQGPKDDLQSLAYSLIYMLTGYLPWYNIRNLDQMIEKKERTLVSEVCKDVPAEFRELLEYADQNPNPYLTIEYEKYLAKFKEILTMLGLYEGRVEFDWEFKTRMLYEFNDTQSVGVAYAKQEENWLVVFAFQKYSVPTLLDKVKTARNSMRSLSIDTLNFEVAQILAECHYTQNEVVYTSERITIHYYVKKEQNMIHEFQKMLDGRYALRKQLTQGIFNVWLFVAFGFAFDPIIGHLFVTILISKEALVAPSLKKMVAYHDAQYASLQLTETARNIAVGRTINSEPGIKVTDHLSEYTIRIESNSPIDALKELNTTHGDNWGTDPDIIEFGFSIIQVEEGKFDIVIVGAKYYTRTKHCLKSYNLPLTISTDNRTNAEKVEEFQKHWEVDSVDSGLMQIVLHLAESIVDNQIYQVRVGWTNENGNLFVATVISMHRFHGFVTSGKLLPKFYQPPKVQLVLKAESEAADPEIVKSISPSNEEISMQPFLVQGKYDGNLGTMIETMFKGTLDCPELTSLAVGCAISSKKILTAIAYPVYNYYYRAIKIINLERKKPLTIFCKNANLKAFVLGPGTPNSRLPMLGTQHFTKIEQVENGDISEDKVLYSCIQKILLDKNSNHYNELTSENITEIGFVISQPKPNECEIFISLYLPSNLQTIQQEEDRINAER